MVPWVLHDIMLHVLESLITLCSKLCVVADGCSGLTKVLSQRLNVLGWMGHIGR
jgi:hypothetical protein